MTGQSYWIFVGPVVVVVALLAWLLITLQVARRRKRHYDAPQDPHRRGPVSGGVIEGSPVQRNSSHEPESR